MSELAGAKQKGEDKVRGVQSFVPLAAWPSCVSTPPNRSAVSQTTQQSNTYQRHLRSGRSSLKRWRGGGVLPFIVSTILVHQLVHVPTSVRSRHKEHSAGVRGTGLATTVELPVLVPSRVYHIRLITRYFPTRCNYNVIIT